MAAAVAPAARPSDAAVAAAVVARPSWAASSGDAVAFSGRAARVDAEGGAARRGRQEACGRNDDDDRITGTS